MPIPMYKTPIITVGLADSRQRQYDITAGNEPFFFYDELADLAKQGKLTPSYFPANTLLQFGSQPTSHFIVIDRKHLKGLLPRPVLRQPLIWGESDGATPPSYKRADGTPARRWGVVTVPDQSSIHPYDRVDWGSNAAGTVINDFWDNYVFWPTAGANWDFTLRSDGLLWEMTQKVAYTGDGTHLSDWSLSVVGFEGVQDPEPGMGVDDDLRHYLRGQAPNPFFTAGFRRQGLSPEFLQAWEHDERLLEAWGGRDIDLEVPLGTAIIWGMKNLRDVRGPAFPEGKWALQCPINGKPKLYERMTGGPSWGEHAGERYWQPRDWTEGDLSEIKAEKSAKDGYTYHIGTMGHAICVSEGGFDGEGDFAYYLVEDASEPVVPAGGVQILNWPGQCTFWLDLNVFPKATMQRWPVAVPSFRYADCATNVIGEPFSSVFRDGDDLVGEVTAALPGVEGMSVLVDGPGPLVDPDFAGRITYSLQAIAGTYPVGANPADEVVTQTPPFVEAVQLYQSPQLTDNGAPTFTTAVAPVKNLQVTAELEGGASCRQSLVVSNDRECFIAPEGETEPDGGWCPTGDFVAGRQVQITHAGWIYKDLMGGEDIDAGGAMGNYWITSARRRFREATLDVTDLLGMLALAHWDGETDISFRGWNVSQAIAFALEYNGIGPDQYDLEDTGLVVPDDADQVHKKGTNWLKIIQSLVDEGSRSDAPSAWAGTLWYDYSDNKVKTGCRYCRTKRTAETWLSHCDNGWASTGCLAADAARAAGSVDLDAKHVSDPNVPLILDRLQAGGTNNVHAAWDLEVEDAVLDPKEYANVVTVIGKVRVRDEVWVTKHGKSGKDRKVEKLHGRDTEIVAHWKNSKALVYEEPVPAEYIGWPISITETDDTLTREQDVLRRLGEIVGRMSPRAVKIKFRTPLAVAVKTGMVVMLHGGEFAGVEGMKFRITGVKHNPESATTDYTARQMIGIVSV